jgi:hypothetical protein
MRFFHVFSCAALAFIATRAAETRTLDKFQWDKRIVLVFSQTAASVEYETQKKDYDARDLENLERDLIRVDLIADEKAVYINGEKSDLKYHKIRNMFDLGFEEFEVILIGKDGQVKEKWTAPVDMDEIYSLIDKMPMRIHEQYEAVQA